MIQIYAQESGRQHGVRHHYRIVTRSVECDRALPIAEPFACAPQRKTIHQVQVAPAPVKLHGTITFQQSGWIGGAWRHVTASTTGTIYRIHINELGGFDILNGGQAIRYHDVPVAEHSQWIEALFGPPLMVALALNGVFSLHASAAKFADKTVAFVGESGAGKSTLARYLGHQAGWARLADDILPTTLAGGAAWALPHFPQFKLPVDAQPGATQSPRLPLHAIYVLASPAHAPKKNTMRGVQMRLLSHQEAFVRLIRHTVAARLFGRELLARQLAFAQIAAETVPVFSLTYLRDYACLPAVREAIESTLHVSEALSPHGIITDR